MTTSRPRPSRSPGSWSPRSWASTATGSGSPSTRATTRPSRSGATPWASRPTGSSAWATDNFWEMGDTGPCGPSSELFFDKGPALRGRRRSRPRGRRALRRDLEPGVHAVQPQSGRHHRATCPEPSIDTGAGLERILPVLQGVDSIFDTDLFLPDDRDGPVRSPVAPTGATTGVDVGPADPGRPRPGHVHAGGRRRAARPTRAGATCCAGSSAGRCGEPGSWELTGRSTPRLVDTAVSILGAAYPALAEQHDLVLDVGRTREEEGFLRTLAAGSTILEEELASGAGAVSGRRGLPPARHLRIPGRAHRGDRRGGRRRGRPRGGFEAAMDVQRAQARAAARADQTPAGEQAYRSVLDDEGQTVFVGQRPDGYSAPARVVAVLADLDPDARRAGRDLPGPDAVLRRGRGAGGRHRHHRDRDGHRRGLRHRLGPARADVAPGHHQRRALCRPGRPGHHRRRAAGRPAPQPHRHPPAPRRPADRAGRPRPPAGLPGGAGLPALRLQPPRERGPRGAGGGGVHGQRRRPDRRRRHRGGDHQGPGRGHGGPGLLRRQVRRAGPGGPGRSPLHRAVRRDPRRRPRA